VGPCLFSNGALSTKGEWQKKVPSVGVEGVGGEIVGKQWFFFYKWRTNGKRPRVPIGNAKTI